MNNTYGLHFPIILDAEGSPEKPGLEDSVKASIRTILGWQVNSRNFVSPFGSVLETLLGSPNSQTSKAIVETFIAKAIKRWEQRLAVQSVEITQKDEFMTITIKGYLVDVKSDFNYDLII